MWRGWLGAVTHKIGHSVRFCGHVGPGCLVPRADEPLLRLNGLLRCPRPFGCGAFTSGRGIRLEVLEQTPDLPSHYNGYAVGLLAFI